MLVNQLVNKSVEKTKSINPSSRFVKSPCVRQDRRSEIRHKVYNNKSCKKTDSLSLRKDMLPNYDLKDISRRRNSYKWSATKSKGSVLKSFLENDVPSFTNFDDNYTWSNPSMIEKPWSPLEINITTDEEWEEQPQTEVPMPI